MGVSILHLHLTHHLHPTPHMCLTGTAVAIPVTDSLMSDCEDSAALQAVKDSPGSVGAYDRYVGGCGWVGG